MRCPDLSELPLPPPHKAGWPWTVAGPQAAGAPAGESWPRLTVVMPSHNQGAYIEEAIRSVLLQGHPNVELLVIDGGSADDSVSIICKYERWIRYWVSEADRGQAHALNKGLERASGSLFRWLSSDDLLTEGSLLAATRAHRESPTRIIAGDVIRFSGDRVIEFTYGQSGFRWPDFIERWWEVDWAADGLHFPIDMVHRAGPFNEKYQSIFDYEFACRCLALAPEVAPLYLREPVAMFRYHPRSKSALYAHRSSKEHARLAKERRGRYPGTDFRREARHLAGRLFAAGWLRLLHGHADGFDFLREGLSFGTVAAVTGLFRRVGARLGRALVYNRRRTEPRPLGSGGQEDMPDRCRE